MPANPRWYPTELPALAQSSSSTSALEASVRSLQNDARIAAIRQALGRRSSGVIAAAQQNTGSIVIGSLMPLMIDPVTRSQPATQTVASVGTVGYVVGSAIESTSRNTDRITFATGAVTSLGDRANLGRRQRASASSLTTALLAGGAVTSSAELGRRDIEEFSFATETFVTLPSLLAAVSTPPDGNDYRAPAGFGSQTDAFFFVGWMIGSLARVSFSLKTSSSVGVSTAQRYHFGAATATPSQATIFQDQYFSGLFQEFSFATNLLTQRGSPTDGSMSAFSRVVLGNGSGVSYLFGTNSSSPNSIYRYTSSTAAFALLSGTSLPSPLVNAARTGGRTEGFLCGGTTGPYHGWNSWVSSTGLQTIVRFTYQTEAIAINSNNLTVARSHPVGVSNYSGAFFN